MGRNPHMILADVDELKSAIRKRNMTVVEASDRVGYHIGNLSAGIQPLRKAVAIALRAELGINESEYEVKEPEPAPSPAAVERAAAESIPQAVRIDWEMLTGAIYQAVKDAIVDAAADLKAEKKEEVKQDGGL